MGIERAIVPVDNAMEASMVDGIDTYAFESLQDVAEWLSNPALAQPLDSQCGNFSPHLALAAPDLADVKGQILARRALEVAAAGGHNLLLVGSPGAGKTMLAKRLPGLLPPPTWSEILEVTQVYSVAGLLRQGGNGSERAAIVSDRPFRAPHHSASGVALVGGGSYPRPGEVSLAHNGVLFLDELTEFRREVLEVLRQPLEDGRISISRARHSVEYPARTTLVASTNPCRCGYYGDPVVGCTCTPTQRDRYWSKLSGPLLDRIDLHVRVNRLKPDEMMSMKLGESSESVRARVLSARQCQQERFIQDSQLTCNAHMQSRHLRKWCCLDNHCRQLLEGAIRKLSLSARGTDRLLKVARTIADLAGAENIEPSHIAEAIQYRSLDRAA